MKFLMYVAEVAVGDVGVDLSGRNTRMAQKCLDTTQIGAVVQKIGGKAVSYHVRGDLF